MTQKEENAIDYKKGAPGFEPGTSRSAVECSTTELYPQDTIKLVWFRTI